MAASSSSSSSSRVGLPRLLHDVFLSFRGTDTRNKFISHLYEALLRHSFSTFRDDPNLRIGEEISPQLLKAIEESRVSIVVFSKNYAGSSWCLEELVKIMECKRDFKQIVVPIFYDIDPSQVRAQLGSYAEVFAKHKDGVKEGRFTMERVERWRAALTQAANLSGWNLQNGDETKLIKEVVKDVVKRLNPLYSYVAAHPVGIESRVQQLRAELNLGSDDVRIVGILGVGGIGKTTIAKAIFNCIHNEFEGSSFLADVSETGVLKLQKQLLSNILMGHNYNLDNHHHGIAVIEQKLRHRRVLLVLDDVDRVDQLKRLGINREFFGPGSRIIITTRNMTSLSALRVDSVYSPKELNEDESLKLFSWNAFNTDYPEEGHRKLSNIIVAYAEGLPLVLEVLGSFLMGISTCEWQSELDKLKAIPDGHIQKKLEISYNSLDDKNQDLFLDIAFFFIGMEKDFTIKVLEDFGCFSESGIRELVRRCLVRVDCENKLWMHNVLRDMGREIVRQQSLKEPGKRSRLWCREEVLQVLKNCTGTEKIEGLSLELAQSNNVHVDTKAFANMSNLRLLHLNYLQKLSGTYITTSKNLKWLCWHGFPLANIPAALHMENLVAIDLQYSKLKKIWIRPKRLDKLRFLNLSHSLYLTETPEFSGMEKLEMLLLNDCTRLVKVHNSIGCLDKLLMLNMANCINLSELPPSISELKSLEKLDFSGCSKLGELVGFRGRLSMVLQWLTECQEYIPISMASVQGLSCLKELNLTRCNMEYVPSGIGSLISLEIVDLSGNKFCSLPSSFSHLSRLKCLCLEDCVWLKSLLNLPKNLFLLEANNCISLETALVGIDLPMVSEFHNCPKFDFESAISNLFKGYVLQGSSGYTVMYHGRELPNYMEFQHIDIQKYFGLRRLSFVVPPHVGKKIKGFIACAVVLPGTDHRGASFRMGNNNFSYHFWMRNYCLVSGSKSKSEMYLGTQNDYVVMFYERKSKLEFTLEGGDEVNLIVDSEPDLEVKRLGLSLIYDDDDMYLESNNEQAY